MAEYAAHGASMTSLKFQHPEGPEYKRPLGFMQNSAVRREIEGLDPEKDCQRIAYLMIAYEFPHEIVSALDIAYFGTGAIKAVADILGKSDFYENGMKRYDDTRFLITKFMECGWDKDQGARAITQMNKIHSHYKIRDDSFGLVLCGFIVAPLAWIDMFGWRKLTTVERQGWLNYWLNIAKLMNIQNLPQSEEDAQKWVEDYFDGQEKVSKYSPELGASLFKLFRQKTKWYNKPFNKLYVRSVMPPEFERAFGLKPFPLIARIPIALILKLDALRRRLIATGPYPVTIESQSLKTYPDKMPEIEEAGPPYILEKMRQKANASKVS